MILFAYKIGFLATFTYLFFLATLGELITHGVTRRAFTLIGMDFLCTFFLALIWPIWLISVIRGEPKRS